MRNPFDPGYYGSEELRRMGFAAVGENVQVARNCTIIGLHHISFGDHVRIDGYTSIIATGGRVRFGNRIHIGGHCHLSAAEDLTFGDFSGLSQRVCIYTASDDYTGEALMGPCVPAHCRNVTSKPISVGRYAVIGSGSVVLPGGNIGDGSVVGTLSLVTKALDEWGVYFGAPVKRLKRRSKELLECEARILPEHATYAARKPFPPRTSARP